MQKILIDTDPGQDIDDLLAMWFALLRPELDVVGVTTATMPTVGRARLVKRLLRYLGREDIPVAAGMELPLRPFHTAEMRLQQDLRHTMNHGVFAEPLDDRDVPNDTDAVDLIIRTVQKFPGEVILACIAPLTNIACALCRKPEIARQIKYIAMMGGDITLNRKEHNIVFDYTAADIVLSSGVPICMGTWDVTRQFFLSKEDCTLFNKHSSPLAQAMAKAIVAWDPVRNNKPGPVMYDMFSMLWSFDRSYYITKPLNVRVETQGQHTRGLTIIGQGEPNVEVTTDSRHQAIRELYLQTVLG